MNKWDYFNQKLQKDFFRYTILCHDGLTAGEIASSLEITARGAVGGDDLMHLLREMASNESRRIIDEEFSFDRIKKNGAFVSEIPEGFGPELVTKVSCSFESYMQSEVMAGLERKVVSRLIGRIEKHAWRSGLANLSEGIEMFIKATRKKADGYLSAVSASDWKTEANSAMEKASGRRNRTDNIIELRSILRDAAVQECDNVLYRHAAEFLSSVADSPVLANIKTYAVRVEELAHERLEALEKLQDDSLLDAEYNKMIPVDFYTRNIEKVDASKAFYMIMMQSLARKENELKAKEWLVDGEIRIFTKQPLDTPETVIDGVLELISQSLF